MKLIIRTFLFFVLLMSVCHKQASAEIATLVPSGETWAYLDNGSDQGSAWRAYSFNDSGWSTGAAQLGYGDGDEITTVGYGGDPNNKYITTYFRKTFSVSDASLYKCLKLRLLRDDGAVVYLNEAEVVRSNMPDTGITYQTLAEAAVGGADEERFYIYFLNPADLNTGESNVIAVEIHQSSPTSSDISFDLELTASTSACLTKGPYLIYPGDNTEMDVLWQLTDTDTSKIEWGMDTGYSEGSVNTSEYGSYHQHAYTITGLTPGTKYFYRVSSNAADQDYQYTGTFFAAPSAQAEHVKFMVHGDSQWQPWEHDRVAAGMISTYAADPSYQTMLLGAGDLVTSGRDESSWSTELFDPTYTNIQDVLANVPLQSCMGNHETYGSNGDLFYSYFPYPYPFYSGETGHYWSFDYGPAHIAVVDQNIDFGLGSDQLTWLETDLASTDKQWKFIVLHKPGWSAAGGHENNMDVQSYIQPLCETYDVAIVFAGHNHFYARAKVNGVYHITTVGGAPLRTATSSPDYPYVQVFESVTHYCKVDVAKNVVNVEAVEPDGTVIDSFKVNRISIAPVLFLLLN